MRTPVKLQYIFYSIVFTLLSAGATHAMNSDSPYQAYTIQEIQNAADKICQHVADMHKHEPPEIYWNTSATYPHPDEPQYQIALPFNAFTYHFLPHEITRCTAAVLHYHYEDVFDKETTRNLQKLWEQMNPVTPEYRAIASNRYAIQHNPHPVFTYAGLRYWQDTHGTHEAFASMEQKYIRKRSVVHDGKGYTQCYDIHRNIDKHLQ